MGTYCTVQDVWDQIKITDGEMSDDDVEKKITEAETWLNGEQDTTYSAPINALIKYAAACYSAGLVLDFLFTASEPNESNQSGILKSKAKDYLDIYNSSGSSVDSGMDKINSDFFEDDTG